MRLRSLFFVLLFACIAAVSHAESMTYTFTYNGLSETGLSVPGSGSFSYTYAPGAGTATLTAFDFTDTFHAHDGTSSTYRYDLSSVVPNYGFIKIGADGTITGLNLYTRYAAGSNGSYPQPFFYLAIGSNPFPSSTENSATGSVYYNDLQSTGDVTITQATSTAVTPEPSSLALLGSGLLGLVGVVRRRFA